MLKTKLVSILSTALLSTLSIGIAAPFPAAPSQGQNIKNENEISSNYTGTACTYIDENGDGLCDNCTLSSGCEIHFKNNCEELLENGCVPYSNTGCPSRYTTETRSHHGSQQRRHCGHGQN